MDTNIERQVYRVMNAFQRAADQSWGPEAVARERRVRSDLVNRPKHKAVLAYLRENPKAMNTEVAEATGAGRHIVTEIRREFGIPASYSRTADKKQRVIDAFEANPKASGREIARIADVRERYAQDVIKRWKWEKERA